MFIETFFPFQELITISRLFLVIFWPSNMLVKTVFRFEQQSEIIVRFQWLKRRLAASPINCGWKQSLSGKVGTPIKTDLTKNAAMSESAEYCRYRAGLLNQGRENFRVSEGGGGVDNWDPQIGGLKLLEY